MVQSTDQAVVIDGKRYELNKLPRGAQVQLANIAFCDAQIRQLNNEWAVADTARLGYLAALKRETTKAN